MANNSRVASFERSNKILDAKANGQVNQGTCFTENGQKVLKLKVEKLMERLSLMRIFNLF